LEGIICKPKTSLYPFTWIKYVHAQPPRASPLRRSLSQPCSLCLPDETFDVGVETRTPVDDRDYRVPFRFTGKLNKLTGTLKPVTHECRGPEDAAQHRIAMGIQ
jgi:hypothetical protein